MKIAYCITAYNNFIHLERLLNKILNNNLDENSVFLHVDKKVNLPSSILDIFSNNERITIVQDHIIWWGGWSHQQAILDLLKMAKNKNKFEKYVIMSGQDYQVCSDRYLHDTLNSKFSFMNILEGFHPSKPEWRINKIHFEGFDRRNNKSIKTILMKSVEKLIYIFYKNKKYPFDKIYHGSTWCIISNEALEYIFKYIDENPRFISFYKKTWCAEESFLFTILGNSPLGKDIRPGVFYTDWNGPNPPIVLNKTHVELFIRGCTFKNDTYQCEYKALFARKFNDNSKSILDLLDAHQLSKK